MVRVLIASDGWTTPGTAMHGYARDVLESVRRAGVDATAGPLENFTDGRAFGGTLGPVARCLFAGYDNPEHRLVHNTGWPPNGRRGAAVVTFHDLYAFHDPDRWAFLRRAAYRAMARRARTVVAETAFIAGEIGRFLGRP
ncbi:MAG TPA: hypothetical protein VLY85_00050, partial [Thermoplasmata archaeon]|nr:hypothetical protein [Thermoplasmata archaeon]